jgi:lipopolysaccharide export system permease protein
MKVLTGYIVREVVKGSIIALLLLLTLYNLFTFSDQLKDLGKGGYDLKQILIYLSLTSPRMVYELMPSAALLGSLFVVGSMANNREIVAIRAAGLSIFWVIKSIMLAGLVLVVLAVLIGEYVAPGCERTAQVLRTSALNDGAMIRSQYGMWLREGNRFVNVRKILDDGSLGDIRIYEIDDRNKLSDITEAEHAQFQGKDQWELQRVTQSKITSNRIFAEHQEKLPWQSTIDSDLLKVAVVDSDNLSLYDLFMYIDFLKQNNQKSKIYELAFWSRLVNPFVTFVMLMVSVPFVVGIGRGSSTGARILIGIVIGMTFNILDKVAGNMGLVYDMNPMIVAICPSALMLLAASYAIRKMS